jgi:hypothetical protein
LGGPVSKGTGRSKAWGGLREGESFAGGSKAWEGGIGESTGSKGLAGASEAWKGPQVRYIKQKAKYLNKSS